MDIKESDILGTRIGEHWYYQSKARAVMRLLGAQTPRTILDVGAGSGFFSRYLLAHTDAQRAVCVDISYADDSSGAEAGKPIAFRRTIDSSDADLVILMDVLEHVDDDVTLLSDYVCKAPSGARFLLSVPAFRFLWSDHDVFLDHRRRYTLPQLEAVVVRAGLDPEQSCYYFGFVFPAAVATRFGQRWLRSATAKPRSQLKIHTEAVNAVLATACRLELPLLRFNRLVGLTAFCVARRA